MRQYGLAIDPGVENGICLFSWSDTEPIRIEKLWQFPGGATGLAWWIRKNQLRAWPIKSLDAPVMAFNGEMIVVNLIVEKFTPRPHETFALTAKTVEPLRGEGVLIGNGFLPHIDWREPSQQYFIGSNELPLEQKKKQSREFLKLHGMYVTGKNVSRPNADDAISATLHAIGWMRKKKHLPTLRALFGEGS